MKISGFTIAKNVIKYNYPVIESIRSILPICDEFIVNVGYSEDETLKLIQSLKDPKIRIIQNEWDLAQKPDVLSYQTNLALKECSGDWAFYLQSDEVIHEADLSKLQSRMLEFLNDEDVDAFQLQWFHFYGSYCRYRVDHGWFQKQVRVIRNNGCIKSCTDAWTFKRDDDQPFKIKRSGCFLYHYGWVHPEDVMALRRKNANYLWNEALTAEEQRPEYAYGDLNRFPVYFGTHPRVMEEKITQHRVTREDQKDIRGRFWWYPPYIFKIRYKTGLRMRKRIE